MNIARFPYPNSWLPYLREFVPHDNPFRLWEYCWSYFEACGPTTYLDVGDFGSGGNFHFANFLRNHKQNVVLVEPNMPEGDYDGFHNFCCKAHEYSGPPLDVIFCISVIEHMELEDLKSFMEVLPSFLKPGGKAIFTCDLHIEKPAGLGGESFGRNLNCKDVSSWCSLPLYNLSEPIAGFDGFDIEQIKNDSSLLVSVWEGVPLTAQGFMFEKPISRLHGILCTMNEGDIIQEWLSEHKCYFESIVAIDNSKDGTREILEADSEVCTLRQEDLINGEASDQIRNFGLIKLRELGLQDGDWVQMCQADEFLIQDPRVIIGWANIFNTDVVWWTSLFFLPRPEEGDIAFNKDLSIHQRSQQYWKRDPFLEPRTYKIYSDTGHMGGDPTPIPYERYTWSQHKLPFHPPFKHYGWRSVEHVKDKLIIPFGKFVQDSPRVESQRWGSIRGPISSLEELYNYSDGWIMKEFNLTDFQPSQWHSQIPLQ